MEDSSYEMASAVQHQTTESNTSDAFSQPTLISADCIVYYSHQPDTEKNHIEKWNVNQTSLILCASVDELLLLLESDAIEQIVFGPSVSLHERTYISRWARIFKPSLTCIDLDETFGVSLSARHHVA
jgi:hypothetical protein